MLLAFGFSARNKKMSVYLAVTPTPQGRQSMRGEADTSLEKWKRIDTFYWQK
jgi:hypothetical protein